MADCTSAAGDCAAAPSSSARIVANAAQLQILIERGLYVDHDDSLPDEEAAGAEGAKRRTTLFDLWKQTTARLDLLLNSIDHAGFADRCDSFAGLLMALVERDTDIAIYHSVRQDPSRLSLYGLAHSLHCAMVCQLAVTRAGWPADRVRTLVKAALTMNLSIVELQGRFATIGRLNDDQREQVRAHPQAAADRLQAAGVVDGDWLQAVLPGSVLKHVISLLAGYSAPTLEAYMAVCVRECVCVCV